MKMRPATLEDAALLYAWRTDPETLQQCFEPPPPSLEAHVAWLERQLAAGVWLFLAEREGIPIGTLRLDEALGGGAVLSLTIAPEARGQRLATPVILAGCQEAVTRGLTVVRAYVKWGNDRSRRAFEAAGFKRGLHDAHTVTYWRAAADSAVSARESHGILLVTG